MKRHAPRAGIRCGINRLQHRDRRKLTVRHFA
jgi:hypothetical protein